MAIKRTDMAIFSDPLHVDLEILHAPWFQPEEKAMCVVDKVIVPMSAIVHIQDNFRELIQGNTMCIDRLLDEFHGTTDDFLFLLAITDVALCEYTLGNGLQQGCNVHDKETY